MPSPLESIEALNLGAAVAAPAATPKAAALPPLVRARTGVASPLWHKPGAVKLNAPSQELQDLKDRYLSWMISTRYAEDSVKHAHNTVEWLFRFLGMRGIARVADVTPEVLNDYSLWLRSHKNVYKQSRLVGTRTILYRLVGVKWFFKWLAKNMIVLYDPAADVELPKFQQGLPQTILTQAEARKLLDGPDLRSPIGYRDKAILELFYSTGIRSGELVRLKVTDLDFKARTLTIRRGKGGKDRIMPVPALTMGYLDEYLKKVRPRFARSMKKANDDAGLFMGWFGAKADKGLLTETFRRTRKRAGIEKPVTAMVLRHSIASHLLENGMDVRMIQEFLGHERLKTTQIYARVTLTGLRKHYNKHHPKEKRLRKIGAEAAG